MNDPAATTPHRTPPAARRDACPAARAAGAAAGATTTALAALTPRRSRLRAALAALTTGLALLAAPHTGARAADDCPPVATPPAPAELQSLAAAGARDRGVLWRLTRDGRTSHLYGTLHIGRRDWMLPGPALREALAASDTIALELDLLDPTVARDLQQRLADAPRIELPPALAARLARAADAACLPALALAAMRPELQAVTLTVLAGRRDGFDPAYGVDLMLAAFGRGAAKKVVSLESVATQADVLLLDDPGAARAFVEQALADLESGKAQRQLLRLARAWGASRQDELQAYAQWCDCLDSAEARALFERALDGRNPGLADRIETLHAGGARVFAAVGALHMTGASAVQALLARRGFVVERVVFR